MANYYLVKGSNAVAVVQTWPQALRIKRYFKGFNTKRYDAYDEANADGLDHLSEITPYYITLPEFLELGKVVAVSALSRNYQNKEE